MSTFKRYAQAVEAWLDDVAFPRVVAYATHPFTITATMLLLIPLILFASVTALALILGNYTNVVSAAVSSIVLLQSMRHREETKHLHRKIDRLHEKFDAQAPKQPTRKATK